MFLGVKLDKNNYFAGHCMESSNKKIVEANGVLVNSFPPNEDKTLWPAYKYENNEWILDENKLIDIQEKINKQDAIEKKFIEIDELKNKLSNTDYNAIKCLEQIIKHFEAVLPLGEYKSIGNNREAWRERINKLEEEIKEIEGGEK